jgi:hypothetical protein
VLVLVGKLLKFLHYVVLISINEEKKISPFLSNFAEEVMTIKESKNQSWISIHCYVVVGFKLLLILFTLKCLVESGTTITNIEATICFVLLVYGGLFQGWIAECFVCLRIDGASTFQGARVKITILMETREAPYFIKIHCMAPRMNLVV